MTNPKRNTNKYRPVEHAPPPAKLPQRSKDNFESPQMGRPEPYEKARRGKTRS